MSNYTTMDQIIPVKSGGKLDDGLKAKEKAEIKFIPKGAIAFFILLVMLGLFIWFAIYFLMLDRT